MASYLNNPNTKILKGNIIFTKSKDDFVVLEQGFIVVKDNCVQGAYQSLPETYHNLDAIDFLDCGDHLIVPGFVDVHLHAPQFENIGIGLDKELLPWLETYTFPEEAKFSDLNYAQHVYTKLIHQLIEVGTTRSVIFASLHKEATELLMDQLASAGLGAYVGKVNMDRNCPDYLIETTADSLRDTRRILEKYSHNKLVRPIITPRFVPTCTPELMKGLGELAVEFDVPVQSHLSENLSEIEWVKSLHPDRKDYADVYDQFGLFGSVKTIMAHCVYNTEREIKRMRDQGVFVAHCPNSNANIASGIAPAKKYLQENIRVGLGSDVSGGDTLNMTRCMVTAMQVSGLYTRCVDECMQPLSFVEAFYMATKGGGEFFGKVGSFEPGYEFDALIINDKKLLTHDKKTLLERLQRFVYSGDSGCIQGIFVNGAQLK